MEARRTSVVLITSGLSDGVPRLQPWRYLHETALQLMVQGCQVTIMSDGASQAGAPEKVGGVPVRRIPTVACPSWRSNPDLQRCLLELAPDVILWHVGLASFLHQRWNIGVDAPVIGVFTSPIYRPRDILRLGIMKIARGYRLSALHLIGALVPRYLLKRLMSKNGRHVQCLVTQTSTTRRLLLEGGLWPKPVAIIRPGVGAVWTRASAGRDEVMRRELDYTASETVIVYLGSPQELRGVLTLVRAFKIAHDVDPALRLLILSRQISGEWLSESSDTRDLLHSSTGQAVKVINAFLTEEAVVRHVAASDIVALPFELLPSDAPLSVLEAQALGKPVVTTEVACLPEMAASGVGYVVPPGDASALAQALRRAILILRDQAGSACAASETDPLRPGVRSWHQMGEDWARLIQVVVATKGEACLP